MATVFAWASAMPARSASRFLLCARRAHFALAKLVGLVVQQSAQVSCHDAPIFRLLLKIAVSLTASNVTFSIFVRLRAANNTSINVAAVCTVKQTLSHPSWSADSQVYTRRRGRLCVLMNLLVLLLEMKKAI